MPRPLAAIPAFVRSFTPLGVPPIARRNFGREMSSAMLLPMAVACAEGNVVSVLIKKGFIPGVAEQTGRDPASFNQLVALVAAAGPLAMLTSVAWTRLFHGRDRIRAINVLQIVVLLCVGLMALMPVTLAGLYGLVAIMLVARCCLTGIVTARTDVWRANYPESSRAQISGRIAMMTSLIVATTSVLVGAIIDAAPGRETVTALLDGSAGLFDYLRVAPIVLIDTLSPGDTPFDRFRVVYGLALLAGLGGVYAYGKIRWRGRGRHLSIERDAGPERLDTPGPRAMLGVLRNDLVYRRFMVAQFLLGLPNIASGPVFVIALENNFNIGYTMSLLLVQVLPILMPLFTIPVWARLLDRMHVIRYRTFHSWFFVGANLFAGIGLLTGELWVLFVSRILLGVAFGGGMLAWQLGHHDFAKRELASIYMGIHVTLTGVRGLVAPFIGVALYSGVIAGTGAGVLATGIGAWAFLVFAFVGVIATLLFYKLQRDTRSEKGAIATTDRAP